MIHAIDIVQQDDMMDDHPTSWVPWMPSDFQAHQLGDGAAFGHSMYHCDALQKQEKGTGHYWSQHLFNT